MRLQRKTDYYRLCFDLQVILFSERFISIIKYEETVQIMPHEKALQRNISNKYQMIACLYITDRNFKFTRKIFSKYLIDFDVKEKRKPNVGKGFIL